MKIWCAHALAGVALLSVAADVAQAQAPNKAQQDAIRSNCRSDFMRNCSSVTPGGREALECLMQNKAKVSAGSFEFVFANKTISLVIKKNIGCSGESIQYLKANIVACIFVFCPYITETGN